VAVELDRRILPRSEWGAAVLRPGARLEIVQFVGGG
jgi:thiamine biosynthesis protein ThiS